MIFGQSTPNTMTGKLFILFFLAACVLPGQSSLLGSRKCTYGPSYWCSSLQGAKECNAVQHCIQSVWEKQQLPEDNDDICTICKDMVQQARDQLLSNETQEEIRAVFDGSCRLIPVKVVSDECVHLADDFIPELIDTLASQMNPQMVCATAGLCNSVAVDRLLREYQKTHPSHENAIVPVQARPVQPPRTPQPGDCESCKDFVARTIRLVKTHSRSELMDRLLAICGRLGSVSDGCMALVEANFNGIYEFLTEKLSPENFCDLVEMCESQMEESNFYQRPALPHSGDEICDFCEVIVQHWRDVLTANTTEVEFKEILDGLCRQTGSFSKNCLSLVDEYYQPLYNLFISEIQPKQICESVGLCGVKSVFKQQPPVWTLLLAQEPADVVPQVPLLPAIHVHQQQPGGRMTGMDEAAAIAQEAPQPHLPRVPLTRSGIAAVSHVGGSGVVAPAVGKTGVRDDNKCVMCEFVLQFVRNMLEQKDTREDIEHAVESVCDLMPHTLSEECEDYVEAYGDQVIELLAQEIDPAQVCQMIHLCPAQPQAVAVREDVSCVMCEYAMTQLDQMLEDHKTEEDIRRALDRVCGILPKTVRGQCQVFVDTYTDQIIHLLLNELTPDQVCIELHLCKPKAAQLEVLSGSNQLPVSRMFVGMPAQVAESGNGGTDGKQIQSTACVLCEFVLQQIDQFLEDNTTKNEIIEAVDFVCAHLPSTLMNDCIGFVDLYGDSIIDLLVNQDLDPKLICQSLTLCKPASLTGLKATRSLDKCQICEAIVTQVDNELEREDTERLIDNLLENVCKYMPFHTSRQCRDMVEVYGPYVANLLAELLVPKKVCEELHACHRTPGQQSLIGGNKCSWGPSYWCQTKIHASACNVSNPVPKTILYWTCYSCPAPTPHDQPPPTANRLCGECTHPSSKHHASLKSCFMLLYSLHTHSELGPEEMDNCNIPPSFKFLGVFLVHDMTW
ncbi:Prosaposin [Chionoecetes opilio]|uniref:Pulmonary surfactant-associated protein B n=1 Tax=Chionoecetes opilio TaxID=41210 RepID=A0A8J4Y1A7_CHIOP|nr:Prosaposin [Chionoecetes opilio]